MLKSVFCKLWDSATKKSIEIGQSCRRYAASSDVIPSERTDCVVIGAGVVGTAVARALSMAGRDVLVVESASTFGTGISSRNSEVIHDGIYYPTNSLKATFCVKGRELLYKYCSHREIPHANIGKLIVATRSSEIPKLTALLNCGVANGVTGLRMMEVSEATMMEPELFCVKALWSPCSGIVDGYSLMLSFVGDAEHHGTTFSYNTAVVGGHAGNKKFHLHVVESRDLEGFMNHHLQPQLMLVSDFVINCAGLSAMSLAKRFRGLSHAANLDPSYARGCYFRLSKSVKSPFKHLIYPIPEDGGLGVHVTLDLSGQMKFGPDVEWLEVDEASSFLNKFDYSVDDRRSKMFYPEIRKYYPNLEDGSLEPDYAGIRPKLSGPKQPFMDFLVQGEESHGVAGLVNLFGIESPGLTSCMAIADYVVSSFSLHRATAKSSSLRFCFSLHKAIAIKGRMREEKSLESGGASSHRNISKSCCGNEERSPGSRRRQRPVPPQVRIRAAGAKPWPLVAAKGIESSSVGEAAFAIGGGRFTLIFLLQ